MISLIICLLFISILFFWSYYGIQRYILLNKYKIFLELFDYFLNKSYDVIYTDQLIAYTSAGVTNLPKEEQETIERNFIKVTLDIMGYENERTLIKFFGNERTLISNILIYFRQKLQTDQIAKLLNNKITI